jgi:hypothetical protein
VDHIYWVKHQYIHYYCALSDQVELDHRVYCMNYFFCRLNFHQYENEVNVMANMKTFFWNLRISYMVNQQYLVFESIIYWAEFLHKVCACFINFWNNLYFVKYFVFFNLNHKNFLKFVFNCENRYFWVIKTYIHLYVSSFF